MSTTALHAGFACLSNSKPASAGNGSSSHQQVQQEADIEQGQTGLIQVGVQQQLHQAGLTQASVQQQQQQEQQQQQHEQPQQQEQQQQEQEQQREQQQQQEQQHQPDCKNPWDVGLPESQLFCHSDMMQEDLQAYALLLHELKAHSPVRSR